MSMLNNVILRSEKGRPLSGEELDGNFYHLREYMKAFDPGSAVDLDLATDELLKFGDGDQFSLSTDGSKLILKANENLAGGPAFVIRDNGNQPLFSVMENGDIHCLGQFQIDPDQLSLDLSDVSDLSTDYLTFNNMGSDETSLSDEEPGTIAFAGGELFVKI